MTVPTLQTTRLCLRALALTDAEALLPALSSDANMRYWSRGPIMTVDAVRAYIGGNVSGVGVQCFAICERARPGDSLGWVVLMDGEPLEVEVGFILRPDAQGRGLAREALDRVLRHAFETRGLRRVTADADPENEASVRLLKAAGFVVDRHVVGCWQTHIGTRDSLLFRLDRPGPGVL